jgi:hypothetical protein
MPLAALLLADGRSISTAIPRGSTNAPGECEPRAREPRPRQQAALEPALTIGCIGERICATLCQRHCVTEA